VCRYLDGISHLDPSTILPGINALIADLRKSGIKLGVASASRNTMLILDRIQLSEIFAAIIDGNSVRKTKPDPEYFSNVPRRWEQIRRTSW